MAGLEGKQLGDCEILAKLGQGGMGAVYKARQTALDRFVAIKVLPAQFNDNSEFIARFKREAAAAAHLTHPNIVQVYSAGKQEDTNYFVMEFVDGESVQHRLKRKGTIPPEEALAICVYVAQGLDYAWKRTKLIHRDIKPDNIFLSNDGEVKLGDLGLAKNSGGANSGLTMTGSYMGTPFFVSPEQARGLKEIDFRADIYSLGCTLYFMVSGHTPYEDEGCDALQLMFKHVNEPPPDILQVWPECPPPLAELIAAMIQKKPEDRYQSYEELIADMKGVAAELRSSAKLHVVVSKEAVESQQTAETSAPSSQTVLATAIPSANAEKTQIIEPVQPKQSASAQKSRSFALIMTGTAVVSLLVLGLFLWAPWKTRGPATPPASRLQADGLEPGAIKLWDLPDKIRNKPGVRWENGVLVLGDGSNAGTLEYSAPKSRDAIIRAEVRMILGIIPTIGLRRNQNQPYYCVGVGTSSKLINLNYVDKGSALFINKWPLPRVYGSDEWLRIELRAVGDELTVLVDGQILGTAHDNRLRNVGGVIVFQQARASSYFRNIVYVPLDKPGSGGTTSPNAALRHDTRTYLMIVC